MYFSGSCSREIQVGTFNLAREAILKVGIPGCMTNIPHVVGMGFLAVSRESTFKYKKKLYS